MPESAIITSSRREAAEELAGDDLADPHRGGEQQLVGAGALLLGEHAHGDRRHDEDEQHRHVVEQGPDHHLVQVEALQHLRIAHHAVDGERLVERGEQGVEEVAREGEEGGQQHVGHRRREVRADLATGDREDVAHQAEAPPSARRFAAPPEIACV